MDRCHDHSKEERAQSQVIAPMPPVHPNTSTSEEDDLPQQDGGRSAWTFLFGAAIVEIAAWGKLQGDHALFQSTTLMLMSL